MTEEEYQQYCLQVEENRIKNEEKKYQEKERVLYLTAAISVRAFCLFR